MPLDDAPVALNTRTSLADLGSKCRRRVMSNAAGFDVLVSVDPLHIGYLTGYRSILCDVDRTYRMATVCTADHAALVTGASDAAAALEVFGDPAVIYRYGTFFVSSVHSTISYEAMPTASDDFEAAVTRAVFDCVTAAMIVGIDAPDVQTHELVSRWLRDFNTVDARPVIQRARVTKFPEEIATICRATETIERGLKTALNVFGAATTEADLAGVIAREVVSAGGVPRGIVVTSGERTSRVDAYATRKRIDDRDLVRFDLHATFDGYWTDIARTAVVGRGTQEQRDAYAALLAGVDAQLAVAQPGVTAQDLFHVAVNAVRDAGLPNYQRTHCGHGLGLMSHEFPSIMPGNPAQLAENMVFSFETPFYRLGWGGMMVEDVTVITALGNTRLTRSCRDLIEVERAR